VERFLELLELHDPTVKIPPIFGWEEYAKGNLGRVQELINDQTKTKPRKKCYLPLSVMRASFIALFVRSEDTVRLAFQLSYVFDSIADARRTLLEVQKLLPAKSRAWTPLETMRRRLIAEGIKTFSIKGLKAPIGLIHKWVETYGETDEA